MDDDFNTAKAISIFYKLAKSIKKGSSLEEQKNNAHLLVELGNILGFFQNLDQKLRKNLNGTSEELINLLIEYRSNAKKEKNWSFADKIRDDLKNLGIELKDTPKGTKWDIIS